MKDRRFLTCTVDGYTYQIPEIWLVGASRRTGSYFAAVHYWHEQAMMEIEFNAQQRASR